jgi:phage N-6-adenine-methyltransferase
MMVQGNLLPTPDCDTSRDAWRTPLWLFNHLSDRFGGFVADMASDHTNNLCPRHFTAAENSLTFDWPLDGWLWCNCPFSILGLFACKFAEQNLRGCRIVAPVPANKTEQAWWHKYVLGQAAKTEDPDHRIEYVPPPGVASSGVGFPTSILIYNGEQHPLGTMRGPML